tara:strand:+ start:715 stop:1032 length:318 start_codon:yes stop_codon:yes gene_type:complete
MTLTIAQIEEQMLMLQSSLDKLKNPKLQVIREFTGQYFTPYEGRQYRRMESEGIPIWECYLDIKKEWTQVDKRENTKLEKVYHQDCVVEEVVEEPIKGIIESSME